MTTIELRGVTLDGPDGVPVLDRVDLVVPSGTAVTVAGPPGAGKSALLRVLVGLDEQTAGDVLLDGVLVNAVGARDRDLAMVFQDFALHPHLDVRANLAFAARLRRHDKAELAARIEEVAAFLALGSLLDLKPADLDEPQRQRVAIGRALVRDALGYLFDEPFTAQPDRVRTHVRSVIVQWQRDSGHSSVFTTSRVDEALTLSDQVVVMHQGRVRQVGSPEEIYAEPADLFVAAFLGHPAMNLLPARRHGDRLVSELIELPLDAELDRLLGDRDEVVLGVRPEHCLDATAGGEGGAALDLSSRVDDVEWSGGTQLLYLGYEVDEETEAALEAIEDAFDFDLFQNFFVAELPATIGGRSSRLQVGETAHVAVPRERVHLFDVRTGRNLRLPEPDPEPQVGPDAELDAVSEPAAQTPWEPDPEPAATTGPVAGSDADVAGHDPADGGSTGPAPEAQDHRTTHPERDA